MVTGWCPLSDETVFYQRKDVLGPLSAWFDLLGRTPAFGLSGRRVGNDLRCHSYDISKFVVKNISSKFLTVRFIFPSTVNHLRTYDQSETIFDYLEGLAVVSDIFSSRTVVVPLKAVAKEEVCSGAADNSDKKRTKCMS